MPGAVIKKVLRHCPSAHSVRLTLNRPNTRHKMGEPEKGGGVMATSYLGGERQRGAHSAGSRESEEEKVILGNEDIKEGGRRHEKV